MASQMASNHMTSNPRSSVCRVLGPFRYAWKDSIKALCCTGMTGNEGNVTLNIQPLSDYGVKMRAAISPYDDCSAPEVQSSQSIFAKYNGTYTAPLVNTNYNVWSAMIILDCSTSWIWQKCDSLIGYEYIYTW